MVSTGGRAGNLRCSGGGRLLVTAARRLKGWVLQGDSDKRGLL